MSKFSLKDRLKSFSYAMNGVRHVFSLEHNMHIHSVCAVLVIISGFYFQITPTEWIAISLAIGGVFAAEMFNTAIEKLVDLLHPERNPQAGLIKDIAAGAVLVMAIVSVVIGLIIFIPKLM